MYQIKKPKVNHNLKGFRMESQLDEIQVFYLLIFPFGLLLECDGEKNRKRK